MQLLSKKTLRMLLTAKNALFQLLVLAKAKFSVSFFSSINKPTNGCLSSLQPPLTSLYFLFQF